MRRRWATLAVLGWACATASGCIAWRTHLDPGVAGFPGSVRRDTPAPVRLRLDVWSVGTDAQGTPVLDPAPEDLAVLTKALTQANAVRDAATHLAFADGTLRVVLRVQNTGARWHAILTLSTLGLVPYFGGRRVDAQCTLFDAHGVEVEHWTSRAEAAQIAHLLLLTAWGAKRLEGLRIDALRAVVVRLMDALPALTGGVSDASAAAATGSDRDAPLKRR